jgi:hypothetical protein
MDQRISIQAKKSQLMEKLSRKDQQKEKLPIQKLLMEINVLNLRPSIRKVHKELPKLISRLKTSK